MINREVLRDAVYNSMKEKTFHTIVNTAFVNAIPIDKSELDSTTRRGLAKYSFDALEAAGGFELLEKAIESETNSIKKSYLMDIKNVCCESSMEVANRIVSEYTKANSPSYIPSTEAFNATMKETVKRTGDFAKDVGKKTATMTASMAKRTGEYFTNTTKKTGDFAKNVVNKTAEGYKKAGEIITNTANKTVSALKSSLKNPNKSASSIDKSKESATALESYKNVFINEVNASTFKDLVDIGRAFESADIDHMIDGMLAKGITSRDALINAEFNLRRSICQEAVSCFDSLDDEAIESFISEMQATESPSSDMDEFLAFMSAAVEGDLDDEINNAESELAGDDEKKSDEDDPEYQEMMEAKKAHKNGENLKDDEDDEEDEGDTPEVKPSDIHPDKFDNAMSDNPQPTKPEVIRHGIPLQKLVADAKMTDEEFERFSSRLDRLDVPAVTSIVNDRVYTAMKAEKETYQLSDEANQRLKDAITDSKNNDLQADPMPENQANSEPRDEGDISNTTFNEPDPNDQVNADQNQSQTDTLAATDKESEEIKESVLALALRNKPRDHVSVYSKIQSSAIESLLSYGVTDFSKIDFDLLRDITLESTFDIFPNKPKKSFSDKMRDVMGLKAATEGFCVNDINKDDLMTVGTAMCTIIFTLLQTLHTMNLVKITPTMAKNMCEAPCPVCDPKCVNDVNTQASAALEEHKRNITRMDNIPDLENAITNICNIQQQINDAKSKGSRIDPNIETSLEAVLNMAKVKKDRLKAALDGMDVKESALMDMYVDMDVASMNTAARSFRNTPVDQIQFICNESTTGNTFINIVGIKDRRPVKETSAVINNHRCARVPGSELALESYLGIIVNKSNMATVGSTGSVATKTIIMNGKSKTL